MIVAKPHRGSQAPLGAACLPTPSRGLARIFHTSEAGAPACCRLTRSEWSKPATCRRSGLLAFGAGYEMSGLDMPLLTELEDYFSRLCGYKHAAPDGAIPFAQGCATPGQRLLASKAVFVAAPTLWKRSGL
jgi:hypothetical protein